MSRATERIVLWLFMYSLCMLMLGYDLARLPDAWNAVIIDLMLVAMLIWARPRQGAAS